MTDKEKINKTLDEWRAAAISFGLEAEWKELKERVKYGNQPFIMQLMATVTPIIISLEDFIALIKGHPNPHLLVEMSNTPGLKSGKKTFLKQFKFLLDLMRANQYDLETLRKEHGIRTDQCSEPQAGEGENEEGTTGKETSGSLDSVFGGS